MNKRQAKKKIKQASSMDVKGLKIEDILNMDPEELNKKSRKDMAKLTRRLADAANKRYKRLEAAGRETPAMREAKESGGKFTTKGKNQGQLKKEFIRAKRYLEDKTGNLKEVKKFDAEMAAMLGYQTTDEEQKKMWSIFSKIPKEKKNMARLFYREITKNIVENMKESNMSYDDLIDKASEYVDKLSEEEGLDESNVSQFFETEEDIFMG